MSTYDDNLHHPTPHHRPNDEDSMYPHFPEMEPRLDIGQLPSSTSHIHPHPHPLFIRQENMNSNPNLNRSLDPQVLSSHHAIYQSPSSFSNVQDQINPPNHDSPQAWSVYNPPVSHNFAQQNFGLSPISYHVGGFPSTSPFPPTRLSPPPVHVQFKGPSSNNAPVPGQNHRPILAGSLDPTTGIFYRTPEHPRLRTAQACEKCRTRKAKCSGEHPSCKRCLTRGLVCEYAKEGRVRGPNKPKSGKSSANVPASSKKHSNISSNTPIETSPVISDNLHESGRLHSRARAASTQSNSSGSSDHPPDAFLRSTAVRQSLVPSTIEDPSSPMFSLEGRECGGPGYRHIRRDSLSLSEHRSSRPRPPDLHLDTTSNLFRLSGARMTRPYSTTRDVSSSSGGLLPSHFLRDLPQHDSVQHYRSPARGTPFVGENTDHVTHSIQHHEFAPQVNQPQVLEFQRSDVFHQAQEDNRSLTANYSQSNSCPSEQLHPLSQRTGIVHHASANDHILNLGVSQMGDNIGDECSLYPSQNSQTDAYIQQHHERFQQRSYERGGGSKDVGENSANF